MTSNYGHGRTSTSLIMTCIVFVIMTCIVFVIMTCIVFVEIASIPCVISRMYCGLNVVSLYDKGRVVRSLLPNFPGWLTQSAESPRVGADVKP
jgi:hypothetical protein